MCLAALSGCSGDSGSSDPGGSGGVGGDGGSGGIVLLDCGDRVRDAVEACDDGAGQNTGEYGQCLPDCSALGPHCGDGVVDEAFEECDDGDNLGVYNACNPDCTAGPRCGDGVRQPELGESCDAGPENGAPGSGCSEECSIIVE